MNRTPLIDRQVKQLIVSMPCVIFLFLASTSGDANDDATLFEAIRTQPGSVVFSDPCSGDWRDQWFLDGEKARVSNADDTMKIDTAEGYAVLWTKESFEGDLRIEYDFKRADENPSGVNIIYIQATGDGQNGCSEDIAQWADRRTTAAMSDYFLNMHTYHISYATDKDDYLRGRRYLPLENRGLKGTELAGERTNAGLFHDKKWIHITIVKRAKELWVEFRHPDKTTLCHFENRDKPGIEKGRVGLRLMPGRMSLFKNFRITNLAASQPSEPSRSSPVASEKNDPLE